MRYALVTGGTKGIGKSISINLLMEGYYVFINYANNDETAEELRSNLNENNLSNFEFIKADVSEFESIEILLNKVTHKTDKIDVLVLNAATTNYKKFDEITYIEWCKVMDTNVNIPFFIIQKFYDFINHNGSVLLIGSVMGRNAHGLSDVYGASKSAIQYLTKMLVKTFENKCIRVNCVCPGFTNTPWQSGKKAEHKKSIESKIALKRFAETDEISHMCLSVIKNTYINGSIIDIDGGYNYK